MQMKFVRRALSLILACTLTLGVAPAAFAKGSSMIPTYYDKEEILRNGEKRTDVNEQYLNELKAVFNTDTSGLLTEIKNTVSKVDLERLLKIYHELHWSQQRPYAPYALVIEEYLALWTGAERPTAGTYSHTFIIQPTESPAAEQKRTQTFYQMSDFQSTGLAADPLTDVVAKIEEMRNKQQTLKPEYHSELIERVYFIISGNAEDVKNLQIAMTAIGGHSLNHKNLTGDLQVGRNDVRFEPVANGSSVPMEFNPAFTDLNIIESSNARYETVEYGAGGPIYFKYTEGSNSPNQPITIQVIGASQFPVLTATQSGDTVTYTSNMTSSTNFGDIKTSMQNYMSQNVLSPYAVFEYYSYETCSTCGFAVNDACQNHKVETVTRPKVSHEVSRTAFDLFELVMDDMTITVPLRSAWATPAFENEANMSTVVKNYRTLIDARDKMMGWDDNDGPTNRHHVRMLTLSREDAGALAGSGYVGWKAERVAELFNPNQKLNWTLMHEIGHNIDNATIKRAESTNELLGLFAQREAGEVRATEKNKWFEKLVYKNMYNPYFRAETATRQWYLSTIWQLYLYGETQGVYTGKNTNFLAELNKLAREKKDDASLPKDNTQRLMCLAGDALQLNLVEFFSKHHYNLDQTLAYMNGKNYPKMKEYSWYLNDSADKLTAVEMGSGAKAVASLNGSTLTMEVTDATANSVMGFEIQKNDKAIAFVTAGNNTAKYTIGNHEPGDTYRVVAVDFKLNAATSEQVVVPKA